MQAAADVELPSLALDSFVIYSFWPDWGAAAAAAAAVARTHRRGK